jgi:hypothetical protein
MGSRGVTDPIGARWIRGERGSGFLSQQYGRMVFRRNETKAFSGTTAAD